MTPASPEAPAWPSHHRSSGTGLRMVVLTCFYPYISHTFVQREVAGLRQRGVEVHTVSVRDPGPRHVLSAADRESSVTTVNLIPAPPRHLLRIHARSFLLHPRAYVDTLLAAVRQAQPTVRGRVWQVFYFGEAVLLWRLCQQRRVRHVHVHFANNAADIARIVTRLGNATDRQPWSWSLTMHGPTEFAEVSHFNLPEKVRSATFVACISDFCRSQLMALVEEEHWQKLGIVHCGVDLQRFRRADSPRAEGPLRVLCLGRLVSQKGQALLVQAVARLTRAGRQMEVVLVGDGPRRPELERLVATEGLGKFVTFAGAVGQDEILEHLSWADVFVLPSFAEGVPVALMEAMACELPVVTTRIAGIGELVTHQESGLLVAPGRMDQLADAIALLDDEPELRAAMGKAGRAAVQQHYNAAITPEPLVELLRTWAPAAAVAH